MPTWLHAPTRFHLSLLQTGSSTSLTILPFLLTLLPPQLTPSCTSALINRRSIPSFPFSWPTLLPISPKAQSMALLNRSTPSLGPASSLPSRVLVDVTTWPPSRSPLQTPAFRAL